MSVKPIPEGYRVVTPYLLVKGVAKLLDFLCATFDAKVTRRVELPDGTIPHAEVRIGDSVVMIGGASGEFPPMPGGLHLYVVDVDEVYRRALHAGATSLMEPSDQFYGDRSAGVRDPSGNCWWIATHIEDISEEELQRRSIAYQR